MSVVSIPVTDVLPGDVVNRPDHGWFSVKEAIPIEFGNNVGFMALVLDHPDHEVTATQKHLLAKEFPCVLYVPIHAKVSVQV